MAQVFDRSSNALARFSLVLTGVIVIALGVTLDQLQADQDLHQLPRADLDERRSAGAGAAELGDGGFDSVDPGA